VAEQNESAVQEPEVEDDGLELVYSTYPFLEIELIPEENQVVLMKGATRPQSVASAKRVTVKFDNHRVRITPEQLEILRVKMGNAYGIEVCGAKDLKRMAGNSRVPGKNKPQAQAFIRQMESISKRNDRVSRKLVVEDVMEELAEISLK
jgi:hypothetical protein